MSAQVLNLDVIEQGATFSQVVTLNPVINLTGCTGRCQIRQYTNQSYPVLAAPVITIDANPLLGKFTIAMTAAITAAFPTAGLTHSDRLTCYYDVEMVNGTTITRVLQGSVQVSPRVTTA